MGSCYWVVLVYSDQRLCEERTLRLYLRHLLRRHLLLQLLLLLIGCFAYFLVERCSSGEWLLASVHPQQPLTSLTAARPPGEW